MQQIVILVFSLVFLFVCFCCSYLCTVLSLSSGEPQKERYLPANEEFQNRRGKEPKGGLINAGSTLSLKY